MARTSQYLITESLTLSLVSAMTSSVTSSPSTASIAATTVPTIAVTESLTKMHVPPPNSHQNEELSCLPQDTEQQPETSDRWTRSTMRAVIVPSPRSTPMQTPIPSRSVSPAGRTSLESGQATGEDREVVGKGSSDKKMKANGGGSCR